MPEGLRVFLYFIQRIQILFVETQKKDPKFNDVNRCAKVVYEISNKPEDYKIRQHKEKLSER